MRQLMINWLCAKPASCLIDTGETTTSSFKYAAKRDSSPRILVDFKSTVYASGME